MIVYEATACDDGGVAAKLDISSVAVFMALRDLEIVHAVLATNSIVTITGSAKLQLDFSTANTIASLVLNGFSASESASEWVMNE